MNKTSKFFSVLLLIPLMILLSGCLEKAEAPTKTDEVVTADTILDNQLLTDAATNNNLATCKSIADKVKEAECEKVVNANLTTLQAEETKNKKLCEKITLERYKEVCKEKVKNQIEFYQKQAKEEENNKKQLELMQEINNSGDVSRCKELEDKNYEESCELNILVNQAIEKKDETICKQASTTELINRCINDYKAIPNSQAK